MLGRGWGAKASRAVVLAGAVSVAALANADVDRDCLENPLLVCDAKLVDAARSVDALLVQPMAAAGWPQACYSVMFVADDDGGRPAVSLTLLGGAHATGCEAGVAKPAPRSDLVRVAKSVGPLLSTAKKASPSRSWAKADLLQVTTGEGARVEVKLE